MARQKLDGILLGKGSMISNGTSSQVLASATPVETWSSATAYIIDSVVEYSGRIYRSLVNPNTNNQPDVSPTQWEVYSTYVQDGDLAVVVGGLLSDVQVRNSGQWRSLLGVPITVTLADNTSSQLVLSILLTVARTATLDYSVERGSNFRRGTLRYASDGTVGPTGVSIQDFGVVDSGPGDVGVTFQGQVNGGGTHVELLADTDSQGSTATLKYFLRGWS